MAPRRTAVKTAQTEAAKFDFTQFLAGFKKQRFTESLIQRVDLAPDLGERVKVLDDLDDRIDKLEKAEGEDGQERDITVVNPLATLTARRQVLTEEYNEIAQIYNDSAVSFTFRVPDQKGDQAAIQALMDEIGATQPDQPEIIKAEEGSDTDEEERIAAINAENQAEFERDFEAWWDTLAIRSMSVTCIEHPGTAMGAPPLTVVQWEQLRATVGPVAFNTLGTAWFAAVQAAAPAAPFSPRSLATPALAEP